MKAFLCGIVLALFVPLFSFAQKGFGIGPPASWISVQEIPTNVPDTADVAGYYYLFSDFQENAEERESYSQFAIKVVNDRGLSYASSWDWSYDPSFERMTFNSLYVLRGNQKIDHLSRKNFEIIQREENLSRASYDGSLSVIVNLKDVKAGDIVVFSHSTKGRNPVFKDHYFRTLSFNYSVPIGKLKCRLLTDRKRDLNFKELGTIPKADVTEKGNLKIYSWELNNVPAIEDEDLVPSWYTTGNRLQISDFKDWGEFSKWTTDLFMVNKTRSKGLTKFIDSLKSVKDEEARVLAAVRTVQEKIRYFSFVDGMSAYRPHNPSSVFDNKYGDCKDKSLLLSEILNAIGVESYPFLVSTSIGSVMNERLASPWNFDHCIVQFTYHDSIQYLDPTITSQRGSLKNIFTPDYGYGVIAGSNSNGLTKMPSPKNIPLIRAKEDFEVFGIGGAAKLKVETYYTGSEADNVRDGLRARTKAETNKSYTDFYANDYPEIKITKPVSFSDDTVKNAITVFEEYDIPNFWSYDSTRRTNVAGTYARVISSYIYKPTTRTRRSPFSIKYPLDVQLITNIHVPEPWTVTDFSKKISGPSFNFSSRGSYADQLIRYEFSLHNTAETVSADKTVEYINKIDDVLGSLSYEITHTGNTVASEENDSASTTNADLKAVLLIATLSTGLFFAFRKLFYFDPQPRFETRYDNIGGWLILPSIGISLWPVLTLFGITSEWTSHRAIFLQPDFSVNQIVLIGNLIFKLVFLGLSAVCVILLWNRRSSARYVIPAAYVLNLVMVILDVTLARVLYDIAMDKDSVRNLMTAIVGSAVWLPYFLISERSRGTFTQTLMED